MHKKGIRDILSEIKEVLEKEGELSIRQVALKIRSQWGTTRDNLEFMKKLGLVKERKGRKTVEYERLFSLVKK